MFSLLKISVVFPFRKYYLDVQRREDGFDLSGPFHPREDPIPLRAVRNHVEYFWLLYKNTQVDQVKNLPHFELHVISFFNTLVLLHVSYLFCLIHTCSEGFALCCTRLVCLILVT